MILVVWTEKGTKMFHRVDRVATLTIYIPSFIFSMRLEIRVES